MTSRIINKNIDIYTYPNSFETSSGSLTLGDLHGNPVKLLHILFRHQIIQFNSAVTNQQETYQQFISLYEDFGIILETYRENDTLLQLEQTKKCNTQERIESLEKKIELEIDRETEQYKSLVSAKQQLVDQLQRIKTNKQEFKRKLIESKEKLPQYVKQFNQFMSYIEIKDNKTHILLLGDEVADRGNCDYFTIRLFDFLLQKQSKINILVSNHGCEFIHAYEQLFKGLPFALQGRVVAYQSTSFLGLKLLWEQGSISTDELTELINRSYKPTLKLLDYTLNEQGITLFSHAPIRFDTIKLIATHLGVIYEDFTKEALRITIDQINLKFQSYIQENNIHTLLNNDNIKDVTNMTEEERAAWPLVYLIWNRWNVSKETEDARPAVHKGYSVHYVHGHDSYLSSLDHIHNLDTLCGKDNRKTEQEKITQAFEFLKINAHYCVDKTTQETYLRQVLRYKVIDSDERNLVEKSFQQSISPRNLNKLSLFGKPAIDKETISTPNQSSGVIGSFDFNIKETSVNSHH